jgi:hypothetical protein
MIVYAALALISLLFLTNFKLGGWIRALLQKDPVEIEAEKIRRRSPSSNAARANLKSRRRNCRRKLPAPASARTGCPSPNRPCAT